MTLPCRVTTGTGAGTFLAGVWSSGVDDIDPPVAVLLRQAKRVDHRAVLAEVGKGKVTSPSRAAPMERHERTSFKLIKG